MLDAAVDDGQPDVLTSGVVLAISGSLARRSINTAAVRAAAGAAGRVGTLVVVENAIRELPHFDPDEEPSPPDTVLRFRTACDSAIGVLLAVPEYAFGIPGSFKNALDWTVGSGSLYRKPVAVLNVAPSGRGERVLEALALVLSALDADVAHYTVPVVRTDIDESGEISSPSIIEALGDVVAELANRARQTA